MIALVHAAVREFATPQLKNINVRRWSEIVEIVAHSNRQRCGEGLGEGPNPPVELIPRQSPLPICERLPKLGCSPISPLPKRCSVQRSLDEAHRTVRLKAKQAAVRGNAVKQFDATRLANTWIFAPRKWARSRSERARSAKTQPLNP